MRVVIKSKRQLKKMGQESHYYLTPSDVIKYLGAGKCLSVEPSELYARNATYRIDGWGVHKRFIRKVIRK